MKRSSGSRETASNLSETVHQQLNMYALGASAAGVGMLALAQSAEAKIIYTPANVHIGINQYYDLDLNHDGVIDFAIDDVRIIQTHSRTCGRGHRWIRDSLTVLPAQGDGIEGPVLVDALRRGQRIGKSQGFFSSNGAMAIHVYGFYVKNYHCYALNHYLGNWVNVTDDYLGLKFIIHGKTHYGWARLSVQIVRGMGIVATLTGYAYEDIGGKSIIAGNTHGLADDSTLDPDSANPANPDDFGPSASITNPTPDTPQPASLGVLALGAQGVPLWRRKESVGAIVSSSSS